MNYTINDQLRGKLQKYYIKYSAINHYLTYKLYNDMPSIDMT